MKKSAICNRKFVPGCSVDVAQKQCSVREGPGFSEQNYQSLESQENMLRIQMKKTKEADTETKVQMLLKVYKDRRNETSQK